MCAQEKSISESGERYRKRKKLGLCVRCGKKQFGDRVGKRHCLDCNSVYRVYDKKRYHKNLSARLGAVKKRNQKNKDDIYRKLGGYICNCCGETEKHFLTIEHKNGGGRKERRYYGANGRFYRALLKRVDLSGYEILCMNCNRGKYLNGGVCPHKTNRGTWGGRFNDGNHYSMEYNGVR